MSKKDPKAELKKLAKEVGERIAKEMRDNDPEKEKAYEEAAAKREAAVEKELEAIMAKRKK
jgi:hypothetical protein